MRESFSESQEGDVHEVMDVPVCLTLFRCTDAPLASRMPGTYKFNRVQGGGRCRRGWAYLFPESPPYGSPYTVN